MSRALHICFIVNSYAADISEPERLLDEFFSITDWAEALLQQGCKVTVFLRFTKEVTFRRKGVDYVFVRDRFGPQLKFWQISSEINRRAIVAEPDIFHLHNFNKVLQHYHLIRQTDRPIIIQNHAETPRSRVTGWLQKIIFRKVDRFLLSAEGQERPWLEKQLIRSEQVRFVMEGSVHFTKHERALAQQKTGMSGTPICLWVGNLNANKDPLTVLEGFRRILLDYPQARLYMIYRFDDIIDEVHAFLSAHPPLKAAVQLLGRRDREELENYYNSAHYFLLGSHYEGSGYSVLEAMACGLVPIVTNISSFQRMTGQGHIGALWECGNPDSFERTLRKVLAQDWEENSIKSQQFFEQQFSYPMIAKKMIGYYKELL